MAPTPLLRFNFDYEKSTQAIQFLAQNKPGITQYYVCKIMFFADKEHLADWGRPISGDRYVAMEHGPVPSTVLNITRSDSGEPDEVEDNFHARIEVRENGNRRHLYVRKDAPAILALSESDKECLLNALRLYGDMSFGRIREISHDDIAYRTAWEKEGNNNEMNLALWFTPEQCAALSQSAMAKKRVAA